MITLIIVDPQYDFIEQGKLPIDGGTKALDNVAKLIESGEVGGIIVTQDAHRANHCSFKDFGGDFPEHCIRDTHGYEIYQPILDSIENKNIKWIYLDKGYVEEEFSAFISNRFEEYYNHVDVYTTDDYTKKVSFRKDGEVVICGLAGDICVLNTIKAILPAIPNLKVYLDGVASLDNGTKLSNFMKENNIKEYTYDTF